MVVLLGRIFCILVSVSFMVVTGIALWIYLSIVSSSKNIPVAAVSATNALNFVILLLYDYYTGIVLQSMSKLDSVYLK